MSKEIHYSDEPLGEIKIIPDFLPPPEDLVIHEDSVKITISLSRESIDFFKDEAKRHHIQYKTMIRYLLELYVEKHKSLIKNSGQGAKQ